MIKRYTRQARTAGDLKHGDRKPLDVELGFEAAQRLITTLREG